jgi:hypothetical protein
MVKKQIGWSPRGAHLVLQIRARVLNEQREKTFQRWYPLSAKGPQAEGAA